MDECARGVQHSRRKLEYTLSKSTFNRHINSNRKLICSNARCGIKLQVGDRIVRIRTTARGHNLRFLCHSCALELNII